MIQVRQQQENKVIPKTASEMLARGQKRDQEKLSMHCFCIFRKKS